MKDQLLLLLELQKIDVQVHQLRKEIESLPRKLAPDKESLAKFEAFVQVEQTQLADNEAWRREQEALIQMEDDAIRKAKAKLQSAKNSRDYTAANRELENKRKSKSEREDEVLKMMEALEKSRASVASHAADIEALRSRIQEEEERIGKVVKAMESEVAERSVGRDDIVAKVEARLLKRYDVVMRKRGYAVAAVERGVCQGCHMAIPPQLNNVLARFDSIETCPRCYRLLYRQEIFDADSTGAGADA